jgi:uncharacterized membrane protein YqhA
MGRLVGWTRYSVAIPAFATMLGALLLMVQGTIYFIRAIIDAIVLGTPLKDSVVSVLLAVDAILLGTVLLVIGYGLYQLFVDPNLKVPRWLNARNLDDLKSKLIGVVVVIVGVGFVGLLANFEDSMDVFAYGVGAGALVIGLGIFSWATKKPESTYPPPTND